MWNRMMNMNRPSLKPLKISCLTRPTKSLIALPIKRKKEIDPAIYKRYVGSYSLQDGTAADVTVDKNRLYMQITGQIRFELFPASETRFFLRSLSVEVEFILEDGVVTRLIIYQNGAEEEAVRIVESSSKV